MYFDSRDWRIYSIEQLFRAKIVMILTDQINIVKVWQFA